MSTFSDPQDQPLCDLTLFSDGSVLGLDKTTGIYYQLNPNGCTLYVLMSPGDNLASRGVGAVIYAPTTPLLLRPIVQQLLKFRNLYAHSRVPVWFDWMNKKSSSTQISSNIINTRVPIETARWPKVIASPVVISSTSATTYSPGFTPAANTNLTVFCADTHSTRIWTIDKRCWLELDKTRRMAVVCYPVLIASTSTSSPLTSYEYVSHRQSFATTDASFPECWRYPLQVLLSLHGDNIPFPYSNHEKDSISASYISIKLPLLDSTSLLPSHRSNIEFTPLTTGIDSFSMISTSPAYDTQRFITVLQTEHALFRLVLPIADYHSISSTSEVIPVGAALIYASFTNDDSLVVVSDDCRFCTHFRNEDVVRAINMKDSPRAGFGWERLEDDHQDNNLFSLLPPQGEMFMNSLACFSRNPESGLMYDIKFIMTTASKIFHRYSRAKTAIIAASTLSLSSSSVLAHQHLASSVSGFNHHNIHTSSLSSTYHSFKKHTLSIQGYGEFIFNCNGSVKVVFEDRTLVELDAITTSINPIAPPLPLECACITDKYGNLIKVRLAKPIGFEWYVEVVLQFRQWCLMSASQRKDRAGEWKLFAESVDSAVKRNREFLLLK